MGTARKDDELCLASGGGQQAPVLSAAGALVFGLSLCGQITGQLEAGFVLKGFPEDEQPNPRCVIARFMPTFIATYVMTL